MKACCTKCESFTDLENVNGEWWCYPCFKSGMKSGSKKMTTAPETQFLTQTDLAKRWRISARTLERWRWEGGGPTYRKIGNAVRYVLSDVVAFEDNSQVGVLNDDA